MPTFKISETDSSASDTEASSVMDTDGPRSDTSIKQPPIVASKKIATTEKPPSKLFDFKFSNEGPFNFTQKAVIPPAAERLHSWHKSATYNVNDASMNSGYQMAAMKNEKAYHDDLLDADASSSKASSSTSGGVYAEEIKTAPIFSADVLQKVLKAQPLTTFTPLLPQFSLLAKILDGPVENSEDLLGDEPSAGDCIDLDESMAGLSMSESAPKDNRLFVNINTPWSAFICGSQGSGKSHTLSCMLESSLMKSRLGPLSKPLAAMVFHYDKFTGFSSNQLCEAAYLCSKGIPVTVLVAPTSLSRLQKVYGDLPGVPKEFQPKVSPLFLQESHLNVERLMKLMAVEDESRTSLYMAIVCRILRTMAMRNQDKPGLDLTEFKQQLDYEVFNPSQLALIEMRLGLLESFMVTPETKGSASQNKKPREGDSKEAMREWQADMDRRQRAKMGKATKWAFPAGSLTIVDLSCPFVDESAACAMFNICLALFLEERGDTGRIIALDEAHKFMTGTDSGNVFTESLLSVIRQQRHLATRVIIATQEPTISPKLLDLSSMTIVHRFSSPLWLKALASHLAGVSGTMDNEESAKKRMARIFEQIVHLEAGQALLFSPSAMLKPSNGDGKILKMEKLGTEYVKIRVRKRLTADGGKSMMAM